MSISDVKTWFQTQLSVLSLGVVGGDGTFGLITREHLNQYLIAQKRDPEAMAQPISEIMIKKPLVVGGYQKIDDVVSELLIQKGNDEGFFNDIIVQTNGEFVGLISVRDMLVNHIESLSHQLTAAEAQQSALAHKNKELFSSTFKKGQFENQHAAVFDSLPIPVVVFDSRGRYSTCNPRFIRLVDYPDKELNNTKRYGDFFDGDFKALWKHELQKGDRTFETEKDDQSQFNVILTTAEKDRLRVEVTSDISPGNRYLIVSIVQIHQLRPNEEDLPQVSTVMQETSTTGKTGQITQAIKTKLTDEGAMGLAKSVATNLIDREDQMDKLMNKLESIIKVAEQIETQSEESSELEGFDEEKQLKGHLSDFSVIDLCQILVQGNKTGELVIAHEEGPGDQGAVGALYFGDGQIVHAETCDGHAGEGALPYLLALEEGKFEFHFGHPSPVSSIQGDSMNILMEACRQADEIKG